MATQLLDLSDERIQEALNRVDTDFERIRNDADYVDLCVLTKKYLSFEEILKLMYEVAKYYNRGYNIQDIATVVGLDIKKTKYILALFKRNINLFSRTFKNLEECAAEYRMKIDEMLKTAWAEFYDAKDSKDKVRWFAEIREILLMSARNDGLELGKLNPVLIQNNISNNNSGLTLVDYIEQKINDESIDSNSLMELANNLAGITNIVNKTMQKSNVTMEAYTSPQVNEQEEDKKELGL